MNFLDIILIGIAALFLLRGFFRGLVQEILSLIAVILAVVLASRFAHLLHPHLALYIDSELTVSILSYVIIFVGTLIAVWGVAKIIRTMLEITLLGWVDRAAGAAFGLMEGILIGLIGLMFFQTFAPNSEFLTQSVIAPKAQHLVDTFGDYIDIPDPQKALDSARGVLGINSGDASE